MSVTPHLGGYERPHLPQQEVVLDQEHSVKVYSVRRKRLVFTLSVTAFLLGTLLILFNSPVRNEFLAPGPFKRSPCTDPERRRSLFGLSRCRTFKHWPVGWPICGAVPIPGSLKTV